MQILMVSNYFDSHPGGIEAVAGQLFRRLARKEFQVTWAAAAATALPFSSGDGNVLPLRVWNGIEKTIGLPFPVPGPVSLGKLWSAVGASDVVVLHDCLYLSNIAAFLFARLRRTPVLIVQHIGTVPFANPLLAGVMNVANRMVTQPMLSSAQQVAFISEITQRHFGDLGFIRPPVLVFNGTDTNIFYPRSAAADRSALRSALGLPMDRRVALFVGRFVEKKGMPILQKMASLDPETVWAFAGSGPLTPFDWGLANVRVYSDLRGPNLADLYRASDVFVLPSTGEGFPLVIQEALACGLPVVCSAETATADHALGKFVQGVSLASDHDQSARNFLAAIDEILSRPSSAELERQRFSFVQERYSWPSVVERYLEIVSGLACGPCGTVSDSSAGREVARASASEGSEHPGEDVLCAVRSEPSDGKGSTSR